MPECLEVIIHGVERTEKISDGLKAFVCRNGTVMSSVDINGVVHDALELCANRFKGSCIIENDLTENMPAVCGDYKQLEQVFVNLFINAADAMNGEMGSSLHIRGIVMGSFVIIEVEDSGDGIPQNLLNKIWNPFFTTKESDGNIGLGLSVSYGIVHEHQGNIQAANTADGAKFTVALRKSDECKGGALQNRGG